MTIYLIRNKIDGKCYVGKTSRTPQFRWRQHKTEARIGRYKWPLYEAMRTHRLDNFEIMLLADVKQTRTLNRMEKEYIEKYQSNSTGYNLDAGGAGGRPKKKRSRGTQLAPEHIEKIRASVKLSWVERRAKKCLISEAF